MERREKKVKRDNTNRGKANGKRNSGWKIKARPGKGRTNGMRNLLPVNQL